NPEQRQKKLESGLAVYRQRNEQLKRAQERQRALTLLAPVLEAIHDKTGHDSTVLEDDAEVVAWIVRSFPFPGPGSTCEWTLVPSSKTIPAPTSRAMKDGFE